MKEKFKQIFEGLKIAYGQYKKGDRNENGKQGGKAFIVRKMFPMNCGTIILMVLEMLLVLFLLLKTILVNGVVLILMNTILIIKT
jgi:hypothetical protein